VPTKKERTSLHELLLLISYIILILNIW